MKKQDTAARVFLVSQNILRRLHSAFIKSLFFTFTHSLSMFRQRKVSFLQRLLQVYAGLQLFS